METILLVIHIFIAIALVGVILLQKTSTDGLMSGSNNSFMSGRGSANLLTKITAILATLFMLNSLVLAYIASHATRQSSIIEKIEQHKTETPEKPSEPKVPIAE